MDDQLQLPLDPESEVIDAEGRTPLPAFVLADDTTPADVLRWWDELVAVFTSEVDAAKANAEPLTAELAKLKAQRTRDARHRAAKLREERDAIFARAEEVELRAYALFERTLTEFTPRLMELFAEAGAVVPTDRDPSIEYFWDCLQRPAIEHLAHAPLREIVWCFCSEREEPTGANRTAATHAAD